MATITVHHADHGITEEQMTYIKTFVNMFAPPHFFIEELDIPLELGSVPNALEGPACGDSPVGEDDVFYARRGGRKWNDRLTHKPFRPTQRVQIIGKGSDDRSSFELFTVYGGPLAPQHPSDPTCQDPRASEKFWSKHALRTGEPGWCCVPGCEKPARHNVYAPEEKYPTQACCLDAHVRQLGGYRGRVEDIE